MLFPLTVWSGQRLLSHDHFSRIFQTQAYGKSLCLFRDVNHDSMTRALVFMAVGLGCERVCVYLHVLETYLSMSMPRGLLGRRERGEIPLLRSVLMS